MEAVEEHAAWNEPLVGHRPFLGNLSEVGVEGSGPPHLTDTPAPSIHSSKPPRANTLPSKFLKGNVTFRSHFCPKRKK